MSEKPSVSGEMNFLASISLALGSMMTMGDMHTHLMLSPLNSGSHSRSTASGSICSMPISVFFCSKSFCRKQSISSASGLASTSVMRLE
jgi:hypothetical protein